MKPTVAGSGEKVSKNGQPPSREKKPVSVTESQSMNYVNLKNIESETSYFEQDWSLFAIKELLDNAWDWLNDEYPISNDKDNNKIRKIAVRSWLTTNDNNNRFLHIAVRNSNVNNKTVFQDLEQIFDYKVWHGTKRHQHRMTAGALGDALKRCLGMGYASWTKDFDPDANESLEDKQWEQPLIVRCNGQQFDVFIKVNIARSTINKEIEIIAPPQETNPNSGDIGTDTEVQITLPISDDANYPSRRLHQYYKLYRIGKSKNTELTFQIGGEKQ